MLASLPFLFFAAVITATVLRGREVHARSGTSAWAFFHAKGIQRASGFGFALSGAVLIAATIAIAFGDIVVPEPRLAVASAIIALGSAVVIAAQVQMGNAWRVGVREGDAPLFVTAGLFRYSRNPIFVGMILMAIGAALAAGSPWIWAAAVVFALACHIQTRIEEAHLARQFGSAYEDFRKQVPRWLLS
ncbi:MAG: isoprenylcysteine carboxylmethyltransferase family protein [Sphingopyxis sp.]|nr:isoprenylcysteine carboxylmethyltransferase family protein [Sphingopyxis sp.]